MRFEHFPFTFRSIRIGKRISTFSKKNKRRKKDKGLILARLLKNLRIRKTTRRVKRAKLQIETFYAGNERSGGPPLVKLDWKYTGKLHAESNASSRDLQERESNTVSSLSTNVQFYLADPRSLYSTESGKRRRIRFDNPRVIHARFEFRAICAR